MLDYSFVLESENHKDIINIYSQEETEVSINHEGTKADIKRSDNGIWIIELSPQTPRNSSIISSYMSRIGRSNQWAIKFNLEEYKIVLWGENDLTIEDGIVKGNGSYKTLVYAKSVAYALLYEIAESKIREVEYIEQ